MNSRLTAKQINQIWFDCLTHFDDAVSENAEDLEFFREGYDTGGIQKIINANIELQEKHRSFFDEYDYDWCFQPESYRYTAETSFQFRILKMLIKIHNDGCQLSEPIVVREPVVSGTSLQPKATFQEGLTFILYPLGWAEILHHSVYALEMLKNKSDAQFRASCLGLYAKILAQEVVDKFVDDNPHVVLTHLLRMYCFMQLAKDFIKEHSSFSGGLFDIPLHEETPCFFDSTCYACESFMLAHELGHILEGEHKKLSSTGKEETADLLALRILKLSSSDISSFNIEYSDNGKIVNAAIAFNFVSLAVVKAQAKLNEIPSDKTIEIEERVKAIESLTGGILLSQDDVKWLTEFLLASKSYFEKSSFILNELSKNKEKIIEWGYQRLKKYDFG